MAAHMQAQSIVDRSWVPSFHAEPQWSASSGNGAVRDRSLPEGFPTSVQSKIVWDGQDLQCKPEMYRFDLDKAQVSEIETAVEHFNGLKLPIDQLSKSSFPLPTMAPVLAKLAHEVNLGRGFFVLRGLDPSKYDSETNIKIYVGLSAYIGESRGRQDEHGNMLLHLTDLGAASAPDNERQAPYSSVAQPFHTDTGSILALYTLGKASVGGESKLVSSSTIYNEIARTRPDLIRVLADNSWIFDRFGQTPGYEVRPLLYREQGKIILSFARRPLVGSATSPRSQGIPHLTDIQIEALNVVQYVGEKTAIKLDLNKGEMVFWNNMGILHARNGFHDTKSEKRHLIRLWLHNEGSSWTLPRQLQKPWKESYEHDGCQQLWPLEPISDREYISTQQRSSGHS